MTSLSRDAIGEKLARVEHTEEKTHLGAVFFDQGSDCGRGCNFGSFPNGQDYWISLQENPTEISVQEILCGYRRDP